MKTYTSDVTFQGVIFTVTGEIIGKYIPNTLYEPAEYPEIDIISIMHESDEFIDILEHCIDKFEVLITDAYYEGD